jgi:hypothetical protein
MKAYSSCEYVVRDLIGKTKADPSQGEEVVLEVSGEGLKLEA